MERVTVGHPLKNGFRYYAKFDRTGNVSGIGVKHGAIHDPPGKNGLAASISGRPKRGRAHLIEHVIFNHSTRYSSEEVKRIMWRHLGDLDGGNHNTRTDHTSTFYGHTTLLKKSYMLECLDVFASLLRDRLINSKYFETEKAAVHQEYWEHGEDSIQDKLYTLFLQTLYERNPVRSRIDCELEDLRAMTVQDIRRAVTKYYVPSSMFLIVFGPSHKETKALAEKYFGDMEGNSPPEPDYDGSDNLPRLSAPREVRIWQPGLHQHHIVLGFPTESYLYKDAEVIDVMARILWKRIYEPLRYQNTDFKKGTYHPKVETERTFLHGALRINFCSTSYEFIEAGRECVFKELERLKTERVADWEISDAKDFLDDKFAATFKNGPSALSELVIEAVTNGDEELVRLHGFRRRLSNVTRKKILEAANKYFSSPHVQVMISPAE